MPGVERHLIEGDHPVLLYTPPAEISRVVVYIHGYAIDRLFPLHPDDPYVVFAEQEHHLGPQFLHAAENGCLILIPESPKRKSDLVKWMSGNRLLDFVEKSMPELKIPEEVSISAIGHSAAYRTLYHWLGDLSITDIHLIDALYAYTDEFSRWINDVTPGLDRKLSLVVGPQGPPRQNGERLIARSSVKARVRESMAPNPDLGLSDLEAPLFFWRTNLPHMELVKSGTIIPQLLRRLP